jgi:hypothetical protein
MKLLLENWKRYLKEDLVKFSGILKLMPDEGVIQDLRNVSVELPPEAVPLPEDKWHVTLAHQSVLKPYRKQLKALGKAGEMPSGPRPVLSPEIEERVDDASDRRSWVVWLENQDEMKEYVNQIMEMVGGPLDPEPSRRFHISLANLTGNPGDSVR